MIGRMSEKKGKVIMIKDRLSVMDSSKILLTGGVLKDRVDANISGRLKTDGYRQLKMPFIDNQHFTFYGEYTGKHLAAFASAYRYSKDQKVYENMIDLKNTVLNNQKEDGYLSTESVIGDRWKNWNLWVIKYVLIGLYTYMKEMRDTSTLKAIIKGADLCASTFLKKNGPDVINGEHGGFNNFSIMEIYGLLYQETGKKLYLDFMKIITKRMEEVHQFITELNQGVPVSELGNRKAYEVTSAVEGLVELYRCIGDETYLKAAQNYWESVDETQITITGSGSLGEHWQKDPYVKFQEGVGYSAMENCVTNYWIRLSRQLLRVTGEPKYADAIEQSVFNQLLAAQKPDGTDLCYYQALRGKKMFGKGCPYTYFWAHCCHSSATRTLAELPSFVFMQGEDEIAIVLYGSMRGRFSIDGTNIAIEEITNYPKDGKIQLKMGMNRPKEFILKLRIPQWSKETSAVMINGKDADCKVEPGTYLEIKREWKNGDTVDFTLDMNPRVVEGGVGKRIAILYGPMVLAVDERYGGVIDSVVINLSENMVPKLEREKFEATGKPVIMFNIDGTVDGKSRKVTLVDFISAGSHEDTNFAVWLPYYVTK